jgi:hypothetical protein
VNPFGAAIVPVLISGVVDYLRKHPELVEQAEQRLVKLIKAALPDVGELSAAVADAVVDKITDAIPGQWDDEALDGLATEIAGKLDIGGLIAALADIKRMFGQLPFLGR